MTLDASQSAVLACKDPVVVVTAGPGSGKTATLVAAAQAMRRDGLTDIHVVTFSRAAAEEVRQRLGQETGIDVTTVHGLAYRVVCAHARDLGYQQERPSLYSESERKLLAEEVKQTMPRHLPITSTQLLDALHGLSTGLLPVGYLSDGLRMGVTLYEKLLRRDGAADYGLIMLDAARFMSKPQDIEWGALIIDEAQDIDRAQANLLNYFRAKRVLLLGDVDQSIYSWRGAVPEWMASMPGTHLSLANTYRCTAPIMGAAWKVLGHERQVTPVEGDGEVRWMRDDWVSDIPAEGTVAILCRTNMDVESAHSQVVKKIPGATCLVSGDKLLESGPIRKAIALALWPELPDAEWVSNLALDCFGVSQLSRAGIDLTAATEGITKLKASREAYVAINAFYEDADASILELITDAIALAGVNGRHAEWLSLHTTRFVRSTDISERTMTNLWWHLAACDSRLPSESLGRVQVMTMHASKGLEFDSVVLYGSGRENEPTVDERRLLYVAVTRARLRLLVAPSMPSAWYVEELELKRKAVP